MEINFDKTDRLISILDNARIMLSGHSFAGAYDLKNSDNDKLQGLYNELVDITSKNIPESDKQAERIKAFAMAYGYNGSLDKGKEFLKLTFDEDKVLKNYATIYWSIQSIYSVDETENEQGVKTLVDKKFKDNPFIDVILEYLLKPEPRFKDIENEFWHNLVRLDETEKLCDIYNVRWRGHLFDLNLDDYSLHSILFSDKNILYQYFKELRKCGLLIEKEGRTEGVIPNLSREVLSTTNKIVRFFRELKSSRVDNLNHVKKPIDKREAQNKGDDITKVKEIIRPLNGFWNRRKILDSIDFIRFTEYVIHIIENECLPDETVKFPNTEASIEFIRKTIHSAYVSSGKQNKAVWVSLAHLFKQFDNTAVTTTTSKLSAYASDYDNDLKTMITY